MIFIFGNYFTNYEFGERIAERRKKCGFRSQAELAARMVTQSSSDDKDEYAKRCESKRKAISNWESGKSEPSLSDFVLLCKLLDCDTQYLLGEIDVPHAKTKSVMDITGLSEKAVETIIYISKNNKITWWGDTLNLVIENENFIELLHTITDYIDDQGEDAQIVNPNIAATSTRKYRICDLLQYKAQNLLFLILRESHGKYGTRMDKRVFYSLIHSWHKDGKLDQRQMEKCLSKLDNNDFSDFQAGGIVNG